MNYLVIGDSKLGRGTVDAIAMDHRVWWATNQEVNPFGFNHIQLDVINPVDYMNMINDMLHHQIKLNGVIFLPITPEIAEPSMADYTILQNSVAELAVNPIVFRDAISRFEIMHDDFKLLFLIAKGVSNFFTEIVKVVSRELGGIVFEIELENYTEVIGALEPRRE